MRRDRKEVAERPNSLTMRIKYKTMLDRMNAEPAEKMLSDLEAKHGSVQRLVRPRPRTFQHFPPEIICPICGTNDDGESVLVEISGTAKDGICDVRPMHLACAVVKHWNPRVKLGVVWPNARTEPPAK